jgi:hypothetical protein
MERGYSTGDWPAWLAYDAPVNIVQGVKQHSYKRRVRGRVLANDSEPRVLFERDLELYAGGTTFVHS